MMNSRSTETTVWCEVAIAVAKRSACQRAQVGAVLVQRGRVVATGYNGPAAGYPAETSEAGCTSWCPRSQAAQQQKPANGYGFSCPSIHAEANALLYASRHDTEGSILAVTHSPCADCAKLISNSGVEQVVMMEAPAAHRPDPIPYLESCGIQVHIVRKDTEGQWVPVSHS